MRAHAKIRFTRPARWFLPGPPVNYLLLFFLDFVIDLDVVLDLDFRVNLLDLVLFFQSVFTYTFLPAS